MTVFTSGEWHIKAGREQEFARVWRDFGGLDFAETRAEVGAVLLRDKADPLHFRSFGHWPDQEAVDRWQGSDGFTRWMDDLRGSVDRLESAVFEVVETVGTNADVPVGSAQPAAR
jgi:quinol monooxygenase YgiN